MKIKLFGTKSRLCHMNNEIQICKYNSLAAARRNIFLWQNDDLFSRQQKEWFIGSLFYEKLGYYPNLLNPQTFNEKLQRYKLDYHNDLMTTYIDKFTFKEQIQKDLGSGYVVPLLGVWDDVQKIDFDKLPQSFVLKTNNAGGGQYGIRIIKDKNNIDLNELRYIFNEWLQPWNSVYYHTLDWAYKNIKPLIIAEEYIETENGNLPDYKFLCYNGEPEYLWIDQNRFSNHTRNFYDMEKRLLDCEFMYSADKSFTNELPSSFEQMKEIAKQLSKPFPHVRVDFYEVAGKPMLSELTFYSESGFGKFTNKEWDYKLGEKFDINDIIKSGKNKLKKPSNSKDRK